MNVFDFNVGLLLLLDMFEFVFVVGGNFYFMCGDVYGGLIIVLGMVFGFEFIFDKVVNV